MDTAGQGLVVLFKNWNAQSLRTRIFLLLLPLFLLAVVLMAGFAIGYERDKYLDFISQRLEDVATSSVSINQTAYQNLESELSDSRLPGRATPFDFPYVKDSIEYQLIKPYSRTKQATPSITYQIIECETFNLVDGTFGEIGKQVALLESLKRTVPGQSRMPYQATINKQKLMVYEIPLSYNNQVRGYLRVMTSLEQVEVILARFNMTIIGIAFLLVLVFVAVGLWLADRITKPLVQMVQFAEDIADGDYSIRVDENQHGEVELLARTLNRMVRQIDRLDKLKDVFLASISHELKSPLTSIKGWSVTLKNSKQLTPDRLQVGLRMIETESDRLTRLVEQLLDFSSYVSGNRFYIPAQIHLLEVFQEIIDQFRLRADELAIDLQLRAEDGEWVVEVDTDKWKQLFINLIDNALKFTPAGGSVTVHVYQVKNKIRCSVIDTGCGIKPEDLNEVVKQFYKVDPNSGGNGLGLTICTQIVELHGGTMQMRSEIGQGTCVQVDIPRRSAGGESI